MIVKLSLQKAMKAIGPPLQAGGPESAASSVARWWQQIVRAHEMDRAGTVWIVYQQCQFVQKRRTDQHAGTLSSFDTHPFIVTAARTGWFGGSRSSVWDGVPTGCTPLIPKLR